MDIHCACTSSLQRRQFRLEMQTLQDVFGGRLTAFVHNAGLYVNVTTASNDAPANLAPDEEWNDSIYVSSCLKSSLGKDCAVSAVDCPDRICKCRPVLLKAPGWLLPKPCIITCANGVWSAEPEGLFLLQDYYQKVYPRAFRKGIELAHKCTGLRHIVAISSPGKVYHE